MFDRDACKSEITKRCPITVTDREAGAMATVVLYSMRGDGRSMSETLAGITAATWREMARDARALA